LEQANLSGSGVRGSGQSLQSTPWACGIAQPDGEGGAYSARRMDNYHYPYSDDPESAPLTRVGRLTECALVLLLAVLAVYLSG
jgi:hypothetical protein